MFCYYISPSCIHYYEVIGRLHLAHAIAVPSPQLSGSIDNVTIMVMLHGNQPVLAQLPFVNALRHAEIVVEREEVEREAETDNPFEYTCKKRWSEQNFM